MQSRKVKQIRVKGVQRVFISSGWTLQYWMVGWALVQGRVKDGSSNGRKALRRGRGRRTRRIKWTQKA